MNRSRSKELFDKALQYFPGGVNSPVRAFRSVGGTPLFINRGKGSHIWDADDNEFIDFCCSWGPLILGHSHPVVKQEIINAVEKGTSFGAPTEAENDLAELILRNNKYIEKIRFVSSGTEAVMSAIRLARGYTGKNKIIKFEGCYHGHMDALLVKAGSGLVTFGETSSAGVPEAYAKETIVIPLNDKNAVEQALKEYKDEIACIIIEPIPANNGLLLQSEDFLRYLRKVTSDNRILLIFDEVISGFRVGFEGAAGFFEIQPDIITYGKIIGGGMPVGAYGASREIMSKISPEGPVYQAGTLSGNPVAMTAGKAQLRECLKPGFYESLESKTSIFIKQIKNNFGGKNFPVRIFNIGSIFWIAFSESEKISKAEEIDPAGMDKFKELHRLLLEKGIYFGPSGYEVGFISSAHTDDDLSRAAKAIADSIKEIFDKY